jgi:hypothetical protein
LKALKDPQLYQSLSQLEDNEENKIIRSCLKEFTVTQRPQNTIETTEQKKREKSLALMSQKLLQLFLVTQQTLISHDQSVDILVKYYHNTTTESGMRSMYRFVFIENNVINC